MGAGADHLSQAHGLRSKDAASRPDIEITMLRYHDEGTSMLRSETVDFEFNDEVSRLSPWKGDWYVLHILKSQH